MRGPEGTRVTLQIKSLEQDPRSVSVARALVPDPSVRHAEMLPDTPGIAYLSMHSFSRRTPEEFDDAMDKLQGLGMQALVLDLRGNLGGIMESAVAVADRFVSQGVLLRTESRRQVREHTAKLDTTFWSDLPLVVLVDGESASASEILAGALQDHRRAALVGSPTYGKGMVQTIREFPEYATRVKVTSAYYYSPSGRLFERTAEEGRSFGIMPDVRIDLSDDSSRKTAAFLRSYAAPETSLAGLRRWEKLEDLELIQAVPQDGQLQAAVALLLGRHPTPPLAKKD